MAAASIRPRVLPSSTPRSYAVSAETGMDGLRAQVIAPMTVSTAAASATNTNTRLTVNGWSRAKSTNGATNVKDTAAAHPMPAPDHRTTVRFFLFNVPSGQIDADVPRAVPPH